MLESMKVNSYRKLKRIREGLEKKDRHTFYDEMWDENGKHFVLFYLTYEFNSYYCPRRCNNNTGYYSQAEMCRAYAKERGLI